MIGHDYIGDVSRLVPTIAVSFILGLWFHHEGAVSLQSTKNGNPLNYSYKLTSLQNIDEKMIGKSECKKEMYVP